MRKIVFVLSILFGTSLWGQEVTGIVKDEAGAPAPFANVLLFTLSDTSLVRAEVSDTTGFFKIKNTSNADVFLEIQMTGLETFHSQAFKGAKNFNTITLSKSSTNLDEVEIRVQKPMFETTGRGMIVNVEASPILSSGNTQEVLEKIPGMVVNQDGSLTLKGKSNVMIYMDGKRTFMSKKDLVTLLENTPANEIEKIEVYETPPAKFDAEGNAGIINVVRKKGTNLGLNGSLGGRLGYGTWHKSSGWAYANYRNEKINAYGSGWYYNNKTGHKGTGDMKMEIDGDTTSFYNEGNLVANPNGFGARAGVDFFLSKKNTIGYLGMGYSGESVSEEPSFVDVTGPAEENYDYIDAISNGRHYWFGQTHNINFKREIDDGESLNLDFNFIKRGGGSESSVLNEYFKKGTPLTPNYVDQDGETNTTIGVAKLDYEKTIWKDWAFETGAKASWVDTRNKFAAYSGTNSSDALLNTNLTNDFNYLESIYAGYAVFAKKWADKWNLDIGLRVEHTEATGHSPTMDSTFERSYTGFFPNMAISYKIPEKYSLSFSATRRVQRPNYHQLNPFQSQTNQFNYHNGNPFLNAQYTDVVNFSWGLKDAIYFTWSASQTLGQMTQVIEQIESEERQIHTTENMDDFYNLNFNATVPAQPFKWWTMNYNFTVYHNRLDSKFDFGNVGYELTSFNINMMQMISLPKGFKLELRGFYNHDSYWNVYFVEPHYKLDIGVTKKIGNWRLTASFKDFLNIREGNGGVFQNNIVMPTTYKPESRQFILNFFYKFGNNKVKAERKRKTGSEDILDRAGE